MRDDLSEIKALQSDINNGVIDINNNELFLSAAVKALLFQLNHSLSLRGKTVPHIILNTGDDTMYLEVKGYDNTLEPLQVTNENYVYNAVPRCVVDMSGIEALDDQLTNPYTRGSFDIEHDDMLYAFTAEMRRMPVKISVSLKYYLDTFTDMLSLTQQLMSNMLYVQKYTFTYMGQTISATYRIPSSFNHDKNITFDGGTTESKLRTVSLDIEIETNYPVYDARTAVESSRVIRSEKWKLKMK